MSNVFDFMRNAVQTNPNVVALWRDADENAQAAEHSNNGDWEIEEIAVAGDDNFDYWDESYEVFQPQEYNTRGPNYTAATDEFYVDELKRLYIMTLADEQYEGAVRFLVLEDKEGGLHLSDFIGD